MLTEIFGKPKPILGKVRLLALPGSPEWDGRWEPLIARAEQEATALAAGGVDGLIIENTHDTPHTTERMDMAGALAMALLSRRIKRFTGLPIGLSVLANDPETALAIAVNIRADFIRLAVLSGALLTEQGMVNGRFNALLHYRNRLKAELPPIMADLSRFHLLRAHPARFHADDPGSFSGSGSPFSGVAAIERVGHIATMLWRRYHPTAFILSDEELSPEAWPAFRERVAEIPILLEIRQDPQQVGAHFQHADGLILDGGIERGSAATPNLPPAVDMTRVEEIVNRLRNVVPVSEMDPDIFLQR